MPVGADRAGSVTGSGWLHTPVQKSDPGRGASSAPVWLEASPFGDAMTAKGGKVSVPQGPGLGVEPDMRIDEKYRQGAVVTIR